jgi:malate dehydrogenase (oxaloacetate-decarboxylating)(NADP+)
MAEGPLIMALANPSPEIMPDEARAARPDAMICTGRSDYPNQVNNVLCFPYIFRGALDAAQRTINEEMKRPPCAPSRRWPGRTLRHRRPRLWRRNRTFGPNYLIPSPFDQR